MKKVISLTALFVAAVFVFISCSNPVFDSAGNLNTTSNSDTVLVSGDYVGLKALLEYPEAVEEPQAVEEPAPPPPAQEITEDTKVVMLYFTAWYCAPCQYLSPILDEIALEYGDKIALNKIEVNGPQDQADRLSERYNLWAVPTIVFLKDGKEVHRLVGYGQGVSNHIRSKINELLQK